MSIIIDPEFKALIPGLSEDEYRQLEENCMKEGIRDALVTWPQADGDEILLDGHNRFEISAKHGGIPFQVVQKHFESREDAKLWVIRNQLGRRNISAYDRARLALKLKPVIAERAKERMLSGKADPTQKSAEGETRKELAKIAGVSHDTIHKVEKIEEKADPETIQAVRSGDISINQAYRDIRAKEQEESDNEDGTPDLTAYRTPTPAQQRRALYEKIQKNREAVESGDIVDMETLRELKEDEDDLSELRREERWRALRKITDRLWTIRYGVDLDELKQTIREGWRLPGEYKSFLRSFTDSTNYIKQALIDLIAEEGEMNEKRKAGTENISENKGPGDNPGGAGIR